MPSLPSIPALLLLWLAVAALTVAAPPRAHAEDWVPPTGSSADFTTKMWKAYEAQDLDGALGFINQCLAQHGEFAAQQGRALTAPPPPTEPKEVTSARGPLNDVGACLLIKGDILLKKGDKAGAKAAYTLLCKDYKHARCWDPKGWFWAPADAAKKKLIEMEIE